MSIIATRVQEENKRTKYTESPPFPRNMLIEPTNACNLRCSFCPNRLSYRPRVTLPINLTQKILNEAYEAGTREVGFYLTGESFLHPELEDMVYLAAMCGYSYIYITTNGVAADKKRVESLSQNGLHSIKFSINAGKLSYSKVHGRDYYDRVIQNLHDALAIRENAEKGLGALRRVMVSSVWNPSTEWEISNLKDELSPLVDDFFLVKEVERISIKENERKKVTCSLPFNRLHVTSEGFLSFCCADFNNDLTYADAASCSLLEAWNNETAKLFRNRFLSGDISNTLCESCLFGCNHSVLPISPYVTRDYKCL